MINISDLAEHLAQYAEYAFAHKDREELERVLKEYFESFNSGWIPVSERLPEKSDIYLATFLEEGKRYVERFYYSDFMGCWMMPVAWQDEGRIENIIAWQPLPEPWKESVEK